MTASYTFGTVTVTQGSATVIGDGTGWDTANISPGYFGTDTAESIPLPVLEVVSDTELTLVTSWRGESASGVPYWLSYDTRDGQQTVNNAQRLAEYIARLDRPALQAIAGLTLEEDRYIRTTGSSSAELLTSSQLKASIGADYDSQIQALNSAVENRVEQGGGAGQLSNKIRIGWSDSGLKAQVDSTDLGLVWTDQQATRNFSQTGYHRLPSGLIIQWGLIAALNSSGGAVVNFPVQFPSGVFSILTEVRHAYTTDSVIGSYIDWGSVSNSAFIVYGRRYANGSGASLLTTNANVYWEAKGY